MKCVIEVEPFRKSFSIARLCAVKNSPKPVLSYVMMSVKDGAARLSSTNLECGVSVDADGVAEIESAGDVLLDAERFAKILDNASDERLALESDDKSLAVTGSRFRTKLTICPTTGFPDIIPSMGSSFHKTQAAMFREALHRTVYATNDQHRNTALGGVLVELTDRTLSLVAGDGHLFAHQEIRAESIDGHTADSRSTLIPARSSKLIERAIATVGEVKLSVRENDVLICNGRTTVWSQLLVGRFPDWRNQLPMTDTASVEIGVSQLLAAASRVWVVCDDIEVSTLDIVIGQDELELRASGKTAGTSEEALPISNAGAQARTRLNGKLLLSALRTMDQTGMVTLSVRSKAQLGFVGLKTLDGLLCIIAPLGDPRDSQ